VSSKKAVARLTPALIADSIAAKTKALNKNLSSVELNDILLSESFFKDTSDFVPERNDDNLGHFISFFLKDHLAKKDQAKKKKNNNKNKKFVLILAQSAIRVCDVTRLLKGHEQTIPFGAVKLIKKNKLSYDEKALKSSPSNLLVGTVGRVAKLIENKMLDPKTISAIVVETTFLDDKLQNVWDTKDAVPFLKSILTSFEDDDKRRPLIYLY
jgi:protein CMS1